MTDFRIIVTQLFITVIILVLFNISCYAAEIKGVRFDDQININSVELNLSGVAVLKWAMLFDVYAGAFYLQVDVPGGEWTKDVAKKLELSYFRKIKAQGFAGASDKLLRENLDPTAYQALSDRLATFYRFFRDVKPGDRYSINYIPGSGTELRFNDKAIGSVPGHDFAVAYFGLWLGSNPINKDFRDRLLSDR